MATAGTKLTSEQAQVLVNYYARQGLYRHVQQICVETLKVRGDDPLLVFWKAFGIISEGNTTEAIRELQIIQSKLAVRLQATAALLYAHQQCKHVDTEAVDELSGQLQEYLKSPNFKAIIDLGYFYLHTKQYDKARDMVKKAETMQPTSVPAMVLHGWVDLLCGRESIANKSHRFFEDAIKAGNANPDLEATIGVAIYMEMNRKYSAALESLNQAIVQYNWYSPALVEKARLLVIMGDWDPALETIERILSKEQQNIEALQLIVLHLLCREGNYTAASRRALDRFEPQNPNMYIFCGKLVSRVAGRSPSVLKTCQVLVDRALAIQPENGDFITEAGNQLALQGNFTSAITQFKNALKLNETDVEAMYGIIKSQLHLGYLKEAEQQIDILAEIQSSTGKTAELTYLSGLLKWLKETDMDGSVKLYTEAVDLHFKATKNLPRGPEFYINFNADMLLDIAKQYLQHFGDEPLDLGSPIPILMSKATQVLEVVAKAIPGQLECLYLLSRTRFIMNEHDKAQASLEQCLKLDPGYADGFLLMAQLRIEKELYKQALQAVSDAFTHEFNMRTNPLYYLLRAKAHFGLGNITEAIKDLISGIELPGVKSSPMPSGPTEKITLQGREFLPSPHTTVSLYLQLATCYAAQSNLGKATETLQKCRQLFKGTAEEIRIIVAQAELSIKNGDTVGALRLLAMVDNQQIYYIKAQSVMANIYLTQNNDRRNFIKCYERLVELNSSLHTLLLLAEAYLRIQQPEKAIETYRKALELNPSDHSIASRIGKAYVVTHDFDQAVKYYESALKSDPNNNRLRYDLAELFARLHRFPDAERIVSDIMSRPKDMVTAMDISIASKFHLLLAQVHEGANFLDKALEDLLKARELQISVVNKMKAEQPDMVQSAKHAVADICFKLAEHFNATKNSQRAQTYYLEALQHNDSHKQAMLALARFYFARNNPGDIELCHHQCITVLRSEHANEEASLIMADLMEQKGDLPGASHHLQQLLERFPEHFSAMERAGKLAEVSAFLTASETKLAKISSSGKGGLAFCKGLYHRFIKNINEALQYFNAARQDPDWGLKAKMNMIQLYLGEEGDMFMEEEKDSKSSTGSQSDKDNVNSAKELMKELPVSFQQTIEYKVLENYCLIMSKNKATIEQAVANLMKLVGGDEKAPAPVGALLALSVAHMALKQSPKARNYLRRLTKMPFDRNEANTYERAYVLLSNIYIQGGKFDLAQDLLKICLDQNKSCAKAWELQGYMMEKENAYRDAADKYVVAWTLSNQTDATAKRHIEAIDICHKILSLNPNYPKIKKEILDKARQALRP